MSSRGSHAERLPGDGLADIGTKVRCMADHLGNNIRDPSNSLTRGLSVRDTAVAYRKDKGGRVLLRRHEFMPTPTDSVENQGKRQDSKIAKIPWQCTPAKAFRA
ncbi:MAG: hypothetical protein AAF483_02800 [Planctomycetota bacterium]